MSADDPKQNSKAPSSDSATETIIDVSAHISHELIDGAKDRANELAHLPIMVLRFLMHPLIFIRTTPDLKTPSWVILTIVSGVLGAFLNALLHQSILRFAIALLILPFGSFLSVFATNSILKIIFRAAHGLKYRYRSGASIFAFTNFFWWVPIGAGEKMPPVALVGFYIALIIAAVGFIEKLSLPRRLVVGWFSVLAVLHTALWAASRLIGD